MMKVAQKTLTTKVWTRVMDKFDEKIEIACLRRDAYLSRVIEVELPHLAQEIPCANSGAAAKYIAGQLDMLQRKAVSIKLPPALADQLDALCADRKIPRDAFFNRLLFLLAMPSKAIDHLFFGGEEWTTRLIRRYGESEYLRTEREAIFYPLDPYLNPFSEMREGIALDGEGDRSVKEAQTDDGKSIQVVEDEGNLRLPRSVYTVIFNDKQFREVNLYGLNCYLPDWAIPGHSDAIARARRLDDLVAL